MINTLAIAASTFRALIRSRILYSLFFFAVLLMIATGLISSVTIGDRMKVIKDFGLLMLSLFSVIFSVIAGATLLNQELAKKTIYTILSKPVARAEFILGKYFGMFAAVCVMVLLMGGALMLLMALLENKFDLFLVEACVYILLEAAIVCALAIFFSTIVVTPLLAGLFTFSTFLAGRAAPYIQKFIETEDYPAIVERLLNGFYWLLPHLEKLYRANELVYGISAGGWYLAWSVAYVFGYVGLVLLCAQLLFSNREFN